MQIICYYMDENKIIACLCKFHSRADIIGAYAENEYILLEYIVNL